MDKELIIEGMEVLYREFGSLEFIKMIIKIHISSTNENQKIKRKIFFLLYTLLLYSQNFENYFIILNFLSYTSIYIKTYTHIHIKL